jgi:3,4-dihydroxy 2-butanone 4-phosphate synthase
MKQFESFKTPSKERINLAIAALNEGRGVLLVDDEDRENEGDIIYNADKMSVKDMALMIRECSGIVCLCLTKDRADHLRLPPMVENNTSQNKTAFTVSIEAKQGVTTGVSAADRITTIKTAISPDASHADLARPGHVFPLVAREGGVLERGGHTEGSVDLMKIAELDDAAVLCELTNEDGTMARLPEVLEFSEKHAMPVVTIGDIVSYRKGL